jgi:alpha-tubulin suppressor-like RCC1 family protein
LALTSQGQVYSFGDNEYGQLGLGDVEYINGPTILSISEITAISAGSVYSLFLTSQGQVYSCGLNEYYQLGLGDKKKRKIPTLIDNLTSSIVAISAGYGHSLFLDTQSQVFSCGNGRSGELGLGEIREARYPVLIEAPEIGRIIAISAGTNHSMILNSQGQVYGFGDNDYGQLGLGGVKERNIPTLIKMPDIIAISAGDGHSLFLTSKGLVIITGEALGLGEDRDNYYPFLIDMPNKIVAIAAGLHHSLFLDFQGLVFGLINNEDSELISDKEAPFLIKVPENHKIVDISVGQHSLLLEGDNIVVTPPDPADLNSQGQVYGFGDNDYGQLALEDSWVDNPTLIEGLVI